MASSEVSSDRNSLTTQTPIPKTILAFHKLQSGFSYGSTNFSPHRFEKLLTWLQAKGRQLSSIEDLLSAKESESSLAISFDDGYEHLAELLPPLMDSLGLRPVIFVPTGYIGKSNSWDYSHTLRPTAHLNRQSIRKLADLGATFGAHGHRHVDLTALRPRELTMELYESKAILGDTLGAPVTLLSYPFGKQNQRVREAAKEQGFTHAFTLSFPLAQDHPLALGRIAIYGYDSHLSISLKLSRSRIQKLERLRASITNRLSAGTILLNRFRSSHK